LSGVEEEEEEEGGVVLRVPSRWDVCMSSVVELHNLCPSPPLPFPLPPPPPSSYVYIMGLGG